MSNQRPGKVEGCARAAPVKRPTESFKDVLQKDAKGPAAPPQPPGPSVPSPPAARPAPLPTQIGPLALTAMPVARALGGAQLATAENLGKVRSAMHAQAGRMTSMRGEGQLAQEQKVEGRLRELIVKDLEADLSGEGKRRGAIAPDAPNRNPEGPTSAGVPPRVPEATAPAGGLGQAPAPTQPSQKAALKAQSAIALVEKIEAFVRSQRPGIAFAVGGGIDARVEVERTGKNEVALKVIGRRGPLPAEDLARIREAVLAKGLRLSGLSVG